MFLRQHRHHLRHRRLRQPSLPPAVARLVAGRAGPRPPGRARAMLQARGGVSVPALVDLARHPRPVRAGGAGRRHPGRAGRAEPAGRASTLLDMQQQQDPYRPASRCRTSRSRRTRRPTIIRTPLIFPPAAAAERLNSPGPVPIDPQPRRPRTSVRAARIGRGVAQPGRALSSGGRGRRFESSLPDQRSMASRAGQACHQIDPPDGAN